VSPEIKAFNDRDYTRDSILKQIVLVELHGKDGSAVDAGCACIETKHTYMLEGLFEEAVGFALSQKERDFYTWTSELMRVLRKKIDTEDYVIPCNPVPGHTCSPMRVSHAESHS